MTTSPDSRTREIFVSVVVPLHNHAELLDGFLRDLRDVLAPRYTDYEILLVDDGSTDGTPALMDGLLRRYEYVRYLKLSRKFGRAIGDYAGMQMAIGDCVVILSIETDPVDVIPRMIDRPAASRGIVYGTCRNRIDEGPLFKAVKALFDWFTRHLLSMPFIKEATRFMVFSRQALNSYLSIKDRFRHVRLFTSYIGFPQEPLEYRQVARRERVTPRSIVGEIGVGLHLIFSKSTKPLHIAAVAGFGLGALNVIRAVVAAAIVLLRGESIPPATTLDLQVAAMLFVMIVMIAVLAEYIGSLVQEAQSRPLYYVQEERSSSVLVPIGSRRNVVARSDGGAAS